MEEIPLQPLAKEGKLPSATSQISFDLVPSTSVRRNSYETLGRQGALFLAFDSVTILATLAFFVFLWFGTKSNLVWKRIMLADWAVRSVTITASLTRWLVTQAAFATSMLAGLVLQEPKVALSDSAPLSLMRVSNSGPWGLFLLLSKTCNRSTRFAFYGLALLLTLSTTILQYTSTILLSDFTIAAIQSESQDLLVNYGQNWSNPRLEGTDFADRQRDGSLWQARPAAYPTFVEYLHAGPFVMDGVDDSGVISRAFFPLPSAPSRSSLQSYSGVASALGMRIVCARPQDDYHLQLAPNSLGIDIEVSVSTNIIAPELGTFGFDTDNWRLNCSLPVPDHTYYNSSEWALFLCSQYTLWSGDGSFIPIGNETFGGGYILFNITGDADSWTRSTTANRWSRSTHGEWAKITSEDMSSQLDISICTTAFRQQDLQIFASSKSNRTEPSISWNLDQQKFNTLDIRRQFGATPEQLSLDDRGLLSLEHPKNNLTLGGIGNFPQTWESSYSPSNSSLALCQYCLWYAEAYADAAQTTIFQDILQQTSHPAIAFQAYGTLLFSMYYYIRAAEFDLQVPTSITNFVLRFQPTAHRGFIIYSVIIILHLAQIFLIAGVFLSSRRQTLLNNSWQAIAQIVSAETSPILEFADKATDSEVSDWIKKKGKEDSSFGIVEAEGRLRLRRCTD
jgi:hypothetical protein